jgi:glycolate oxidase
MSNLPIDVSKLQEMFSTVENLEIKFDEKSLADYGHDETENLVFLPEIVMLPKTTLEVSQILKIANENKIPITPRGGGSGLSGGSLPVHGGVLLSMEKFDKILHIDEENLQVTTEPGVITEVLQNTLKEKGLFYPVDPSSKGWCHIGGNVAHNSGGPRAVKYGVVKDYVLNLEIVLPSGDIIWTGANTLKNSTGYNLTQLMVGSEGTLAIVTKIVLKLLPHPTHSLVMLAPFFSSEEACKAVSAIFRFGVIPSALEFMERDAIDWAISYLGDVNISIEENIQAHLLIEVDGNNPEFLMQEAEKIYEVLSQFNTGEILLADSEAQKTDLWRLRRNVAHAVKTNSIYKEEDTVVPRASLPALLKGVKSIGEKYGFKSICYGHAGDGNLHVNIVKGDMSEESWNTELPHGIVEIFQLVKSLNGTISGEHGIGLVQKRYLDIVFSETEMEIRRKIKGVFDPNGILNPGKIFPEKK